MIQVNLLDIEFNNDTPEEQITDVSKEFYCRYQSENYNNKYQAWRSNCKNVYGFNYRKDCKEFAYMGGAGYIENTPQKSEKKALIKISFLLGLVFVVTIVFMAFIKIPIVNLLNILNYNIKIDSLSKEIIASQNNIFILDMLCNILKYLLPIMLLAVFLKTPKEVVFFKSSYSGPVFVKTIPAVMLFFPILVAVSEIYQRVLVFSGITPQEITILVPSQRGLFIFSIVFYIVILPVLQSILMNGFVLQSLRQFGDDYAIIILSTLSALFFHSFTYFGVEFLYSIIIGFIAIRTGSFFSCLFSRILFQSFQYILLYIHQTQSTIVSKFYISWIILMALVLGLFSFKNLMQNTSNIFSFNKHHKYMSLRKKIGYTFTAVPFVFYIIVSFLLQLYTLGFVLK